MTVCAEQHLKFLPSTAKCTQTFRLCALQRRLLKITCETLI
ncbi:hypothetical protein RUMCAL_00601 [Ruminococcus callidus ATCC 27760]|uniref:Uncharacterized protein n=1 Tax=Ruminococcus callidus ATCC 27760 TaxID=411473 RepID=U2KES8_9FIRM|nr:hypothetical protein RUMCAL_00601 [Ruminococcus callidus ATCC 27760]